MLPPLKRGIPKRLGSQFILSTKKVGMLKLISRAGVLIISISLWFGITALSFKGLIYTVKAQFDIIDTRDESITNIEKLALLVSLCAKRPRCWSLRVRNCSVDREMRAITGCCRSRDLRA